MKWIVGVSIIAIAMGWAATTTIPAATITPDEATLRLLPPETLGVAFVDVASLLNAPLVKEVWNTYRPAIESMEFLRATGLVPERDIDTVTAARIGQEEMLVIARARYDKFKAEQYFRDKGKGPEVHLGRSVYVDNIFAFAFLDNMIIAGRTEQVKKAIDQMSLPGSPTLRNELMDSIKTIEAGNQIWAVGDFTVRKFGNLHGTSQLRVDDGLHGKGIADFGTAETAKNLSDTARGLIALAKLRVAQEEPDLVRVLDGVQVSSSGTSIVVNLEISGRQLRELRKLIGAIRAIGG